MAINNWMQGIKNSFVSDSTTMSETAMMRSIGKLNKKGLAAMEKLKTIIPTSFESSEPQKISLSQLKILVLARGAVNTKVQAVKNSFFARFRTTEKRDLEARYNQVNQMYTHLLQKLTDGSAVLTRNTGNPDTKPLQQLPLSDLKNLGILLVKKRVAESLRRWDAKCI